MSQKYTAAIIVLLVLMLLTAIYMGIAGKRSAKNKNESSVSPAVTLSSEQLIVPASMPERFSMQLPAGFTETGSAYIDKYFVRNDASIIITGEKILIPGEQLDPYAEDMKKQYAESADEFQLVKEETIALDSGVSCKVLEFSYALLGENARQDMRCITAVLIKDNRSYIVTCKSRAETFGGYYQDFRQAIKTIRIADADTAQTTATTVSQTVVVSAQP
ncbi:MAG: hypothetical protein J6Z45_06705 [Oscillospiraceae bacterium]|nr:hypothetical protein [Oscillospiraceae bacterium]